MAAFDTVRLYILEDTGASFPFYLHILQSLTYWKIHAAKEFTFNHVNKNL